MWTYDAETGDYSLDGEVTDPINIPTVTPYPGDNNCQKQQKDEVSLHKVDWSQAADWVELYRTDEMIISVKGYSELSDSDIF